MQAGRGFGVQRRQEGKQKNPGSHASSVGYG